LVFLKLIMSMFKTFNSLCLKFTGLKKMPHQNWHHNTISTYCVEEDMVR
jgi:hypothetical protein